MHLLDHWPDMLTAEETAKILRIDTDTLVGFLQAGEILTARTSTLTTAKNWIVCHFKKEKMKWLKSPVPSRLTA